MITCGKDTKLSQSSSLPDVSAGVDQFLQRVRIAVVQKTQFGGKTQEIPVWRNAMACIQPMSEKLSILKEGERSWKWYTIYARPDLSLETDDIVVLFGTSYRIMDKENWAQHGYVKYGAIESYKRYSE